METLLELLPQFARLGKHEALRWHNGFRTRVISYGELNMWIHAVSGYLESREVRKGDRVMIWGENRPEWIAVFWASVIRGVQVLPLDFRFSPELVRRIQNESTPKLLFYGNTVEVQALEIEKLSLDRIAELPQTDRITQERIAPDDIVEIVYTSGTTGDPKGIIHRHRNICANLTPFKTEIDKYKWWVAPFRPLRILNLLPLSHMFGQALGLFIPVLLEGAVVFTDEMRPGKIIQLTRSQRVSVIVLVPRILESLRREMERQFNLKLALEQERAKHGESGIPVLRRLWQYRRVHFRFGLKFWAFVVGGARVDPSLEDYWARLGFLVIQGYGLTEASPVVAVNHPFSRRRGSLGKVVAGQDVTIASDGEILVRGPSVVREAGEWLYTGDIGEMDPEGYLYYRGRKKDLIVTAEGLNVYPEDVEKVLNQLPEVRDSAVVGLRRNGAERVHAVLILADPASDPAEAVERANQTLEVHQRIRSWSVWPEHDFPRTPSTLKVLRRDVARRVGQVESGSHVSEFDLSAMSSLERVELMSELENRYQIEIDEETFSRITTTEQLQQWITQSQVSVSGLEEQPSTAEWARSRLLRGFATAFQELIALPLFRHYFPLTVTGLRNLDAVKPPVIFAANHTSHLDTVAIFAAVSRPWRKRLATAVMKESFRAHFEPNRFPWQEVLRWRSAYLAVCAIFNAYPLPHVMAGTRRALEYTGELIDRGYCPLVFPEGERTPDGQMLPFRPGIGMMSVQLRVPVVPVCITGLFELYSLQDHWPRSGPVRISIGPAVEFRDRIPYDEATRLVQEAIRRLR